MYVSLQTISMGLRLIQSKSLVEHLEYVQYIKSCLLQLR